ncbi:MAG: patatin-like phospholipase family protein, partial [Candidatus Omnitrophota bacterium]
ISVKMVMIDSREAGLKGKISRIYSPQQSRYVLINNCNKEEKKDVLERIKRELADKTVGVALGSGGAYGGSHIGVLKVLDEHRIPIDMICGSSVGSIIASMWALGYSQQEMAKNLMIFGRCVNPFSFSGFSFPFKGLLRAKKLEGVLKDIFGNKNFYDLKHRLGIVVFSFKKRQITLISEGLIYKAVAASCAMPGIFEPIVFKGDIFMDGGVLSPLPTKILLNQNIKKIIAVNVIPSKEEIYRIYRSKTLKFNVFDFIFGSIETMQQEFIKESLDVSDVVIHPTFEGLKWTDFTKTAEFIKRGEAAARSEIAFLKNLISY